MPYRIPALTSASEIALMLNAGRLLLVLATMGTWKACVEATIPRTAAPVLIFMVSGKW